jgi:hypothetical protein
MLVFKINELSSLTKKEWIELKATLHSIDDRRFDCNTCLSQYEGRQDRETMIQASRKLKACDYTANGFRHAIDDRIRFSTCIGNFVSESAAHLIELQGHFAQGVMPYAGPLTSQPAKVIEAFRVIENHRYRVSREREEERQRKARVVGRGPRG